MKKHHSKKQRLLSRDQLNRQEKMKALKDSFENPDLSGTDNPSLPVTHQHPHSLTLNTGHPNNTLGTKIAGEKHTSLIKTHLATKTTLKIEQAPMKPLRFSEVNTIYLPMAVPMEKNPLKKILIKGKKLKEKLRQFFNHVIDSFNFEQF